MSEHISMPQVNFISLIMSLNTAALFHLGELAEPGTGKKAIDLAMARHTIDTLVLLQEKTAGNLDADEEKMLGDMLCELQLHYVKRAESRETPCS